MTNDEFQNLIIDYLNKLQLPGALSVLSGGLARMESREAQGVSQIAMAAATAAQSDTAKLIRLLRAVSNYFNQVEEEITSITSGSVKFGVTTGFNIAGAPPESFTVTETGKTWVTASTIVVPFPPRPITSAMEYYGVQAGNYVPGTGFDITLYNPQNTAPGTGPDVEWIAFVDGYNA